MKALTNKAEIATALALAGLGGFIVWEASGYPVGTAARMGTGFVPLGLGIGLIALGGLIAFAERNAPREGGSVSIRALAAVSCGLLAWALLVDRAGLLAANAALVGLAALAEPGFRLLRALLIFAGLTIIGYLVFILGLRVPIRMVQI